MGNSAVTGVVLLAFMIGFFSCDNNSPIENDM